MRTLAKMGTPSNVVNMDDYNRKTLVEKRRDNGDGNMRRDDYVTHTELELSNERLLRHLDDRFNSLEKKIDSNQAETNLKFERINTKFQEVDTKFQEVDTKFEKQKVWFYGTAIGIVTATCTIVGFLIKFL